MKHLSVVPGRTSQTGLRPRLGKQAAQLHGLRRRLGHQAVLGGAELVERLAYSDEAMTVLMRLDAKTRKQAMHSITRIIEKTKQRRPPSAQRKPSPDERTKINWTEAFMARFLYEAPRSSNDLDLCRRLDLPTYCRGAMRAARSRHGILRASATDKPCPRGAQTTAALPLAA